MFKEQEFWVLGHKSKSKSAVFLKEEMVGSVRSLMRVASQNLLFVGSRAGPFSLARLCAGHSLSLVARKGIFRIFTYPPYSLTKPLWKGALVNALTVSFPN